MTDILVPRETLELWHDVLDNQHGCKACAKEAVNKIKDLLAQPAPVVHYPMCAKLAECDARGPECRHESAHSCYEKPAPVVTEDIVPPVAQVQAQIEMCRLCERAASCTARPYLDSVTGKYDCCAFRPSVVTPVVTQTAAEAGVYHQSCPHCLHDWWSAEAFPEVCPICSAPRSVPLVPPAPITGYDGSGECEHCEQREKGCETAHPRTHGCDWRGETVVTQTLYTLVPYDDLVWREKKQTAETPHPWAGGFGPQSASGDYPPPPAAMDCNIEGAMLAHRSNCDHFSRAEVEQMIKGQRLVSWPEMLSFVTAERNKAEGYAASHIARVLPEVIGKALDRGFISSKQGEQMIRDALVRHGIGEHERDKKEHMEACHS